MKTIKYLLFVLAVVATASAQEVPVEPSGSPVWFNGTEFYQGWATAWGVVGSMFVYWLIKRSANDALE